MLTEKTQKFEKQVSFIDYKKAFDKVQHEQLNQLITCLQDTGQDVKQRSKLNTIANGENTTVAHLFCLEHIVADDGKSETEKISNGQKYIQQQVKQHEENK